MTLGGKVTGYVAETNPENWDKNDPDPYGNGSGYGYVDAIQKLTGRNLKGTRTAENQLHNPTNLPTNKGTEQMKLIKHYSEYTAFKTSLFTCTETKYDHATGQIVEMNFEFNRR